jgi:hypothetical protein
MRHAIPLRPPTVRANLHEQMKNDPTPLPRATKPDLDRSSVDDAWRWHVTAPDEPAGLAGVFRQCDRVLECTTAGTSMGATLPPGSRIRFRCGPNEPRLGDVVVLVFGQADLLAHRVVGAGRGPRAREYLLTRGDGSVLCDQPIQRAAVLGIVLDTATDAGWRSLAPPRSSGFGRRLTATLHRWAMLAALELDVRIAVQLAVASYWLLDRLRAVRQRTHR